MNRLLQHYTHFEQPFHNICLTFFLLHADVGQTISAWWITHNIKQTNSSLCCYLIMLVCGNHLNLALSCMATIALHYVLYESTYLCLHERFYTGAEIKAVCLISLRVLETVYWKYDVFTSLFKHC